MSESFQGGVRRRRGVERDSLVSVEVVSDVGDESQVSISHSDLVEGKEAVQAVVKDFSIACLAGYFVVLVSLLAAFMLVSYLAWRLPAPLPNDSPVNVFAEGRAWAHLEKLQQFGPSLVGSKSNIAVAQYLESTLRSLASEVEALVASGHLKYAPRIEVDVQRPSGALNFDLVGYTLTNHYTRLHNVIVKLSWDHHHADRRGYAYNTTTDGKLSQGAHKLALLVNSHFDSGIGSPGAVDARSCNAVMLEIARTLAHSERVLHHNVIMLFNGAEESLQEGSHGFITKHPWRHEVGSVLNFDAGGVGGPQILFQVGSGEYAELFAKHVPRLHGSIMAQEIFDTGLLQGDTDYRIFRDYGDVHGLDLAWYKDGYKYHTPRDDITFIDEGSLQHAGSNAIAYIYAICSNETKGNIWRHQVIDPATQLKRPVAQPNPTPNSKPDLMDSYPSREQIIFYDVASVFPMHYTKFQARIIHWCVLAAMGFVMFKAIPISSLGWSIARTFGANTMAMVLSILLATFMTAIGKVLSWFSNQYVLGMLYLPTIALGWLLVHYRRTGYPLKSLLVKGPRSASESGFGAHIAPGSPSSPHTRSKVASKSSSSKEGSWQWMEYETFYGTCAWAMVLLFTWAEMGIGTAYIWLWSCGSGLLGLIVVKCFGLTHEKAVESGKSMIPGWAYLCFFPSLLIHFAVMVQSLAMVFPLSGRLPPEVPVELVVAAIFTMLVFAGLSPFQALLHRFRRYRAVFRCLVILIVIGIVVASFSFPYSPYRPKRVSLQHAFRTSPMPGHPGLDDPAVLFALCDAGPIGDMVSQLTEIDSRGATPHRDLHDWDSAFPLSHFLAGYSLPAPRPTLHPPTAKVLNDTWNESLQERTLVIEVDYTGSEWSTLKFLGPLKRWNLTSEIPPISINPGYHVIRHIGEYGLSKWAVELTFGDQKKRRFDISATHFGSSPTLRQIIQMLPDWTAPVSMISALSHIDA